MDCYDVKRRSKACYKCLDVDYWAAESDCRRFHPRPLGPANVGVTIMGVTIIIITQIIITWAWQRVGDRMSGGYRRICEYGCVRGVQTPPALRCCPSPPLPRTQAASGDLFIEALLGLRGRSSFSHRAPAPPPSGAIAATSTAETPKHARFSTTAHQYGTAAAQSQKRVSTVENLTKVTIIYFSCQNHSKYTEMSNAERQILARRVCICASAAGWRQRTGYRADGADQTIRFGSQMTLTCGRSRSLKSGVGRCRGEPPGSARTPPYMTDHCSAAGARLGWVNRYGLN